MYFNIIFIFIFIFIFIIESYLKPLQGSSTVKKLTLILVALVFSVYPYNGIAVQANVLSSAPLGAGVRVSLPDGALYGVLDGVVLGIDIGANWQHFTEKVTRPETGKSYVMGAAGYMLTSIFGVELTGGVYAQKDHVLIAGEYVKTSENKPAFGVIARAGRDRYYGALGYTAGLNAITMQFGYFIFPL